MKKRIVLYSGKNKKYYKKIYGIFKKYDIIALQHYRIIKCSIEVKKR